MANRNPKSKTQKPFFHFCIGLPLRILAQFRKHDRTHCAVCTEPNRSQDTHTTQPGAPARVPREPVSTAGATRACGVGRVRACGSAVWRVGGRRPKSLVASRSTIRSRRLSSRPRQRGDRSAHTHTRLHGPGPRRLRQRHPTRHAAATQRARSGQWCALEFPDAAARTVNNHAHAHAHAMRIHAPMTQHTPARELTTSRYTRPRVRSCPPHSTENATAAASF